MKIPFPLAPILLSVLAGCTPLGAYGGALAQPPTVTAPGAGAPLGAPASRASSATAPAAPSPPSTVSVSIRSGCGKTVRVFFGNKPKFGSGTYSTVGSHSVQRHAFRPGDLFWLVDEHENGLASVEVRESTREIEIQSSCTGLAQR